MTALPSLRFNFLRLVILAVFGAAASIAFAQTAKPAASPTALITPTLSLSATSGYFYSPAYIRTGVPIAFSARVTPPDATGTLTFYVDSNLVQTSTIAPQTIGDYAAIGDSITFASYIGDPTQRYQAIVGQALNLNVGSYASPGYTACDSIYYNVVGRDVGTALNSQPLYSFMIGSNDYNLYGNGAHEALFNLCDQSTIAWLGVTRPNKVLIGDPGVVIVNGPWSTVPAPGSCCINTLNIANATGDVRFTLTTTGAAAYLWYNIQTATTGTFTVSIDGGPPSAPIQTQFSSTDETLPASYALLRLPVATGAHTFDIVAQTGTVGILGMGSPPIPGSQTIPTVLVTDVPYGIDGNNLAANYSSDSQSNVTLLQSDGLDARFVPTHNFMFGTPAEMMDSRHPNILGLSELAQALLASVTPTTPAADTVSVATATFTTSSLAVAGHEISVVYSGDANYASATANIIGLVLYDPTSTTTLTSTSSIFPIQTPITLTATPTGNGLVNFVDTTSGSNVPLGSFWMDGAPTAVLTVPSLTAGQHSIVAQFQGDIVNAPSSSAPLTLNVYGPYTTTSLSSPATRYYAASPVALTATLAPASTTGSVTFLDGATVLGQAPLVSGVATFTTSTLAPGIHSLTASFNGNSTQNSSLSPALSIEIDTNPTTISIAPLPATAPYATPIAFTLTVSPSTATGAVGLADSFVPLGQTAAVNQSIPFPALTNGASTLISTTLAPGTHTFTAVYAGDTNDLPSTSSPVATQVTLATSTLTLAPIPASVTYGTPLPLTVSVTPAASTGAITFTDSITGTLAQLPLVNGSATFSTSTLAPGPHRLSATYSGDTLRTPSASAALSTTINLITSSITLAPLAATIYAGNPLSLAATISPVSATGNVIFRDATLGVLGQSTAAQGAATLTLPNPALGAYSVTATYSGDTDDTASTSAAVSTQVALTPTTTTLTPSANPAAFGSTLTLTAAVSPTSATGSATFFDGAANLGTALISAGRATLTTSTLAVGPHTLHASYSGDSLNATSTASLAETVAASATATSLTLAQNNVVATSNVTVNVRVASTNTTPSGTVTVKSGAITLASAPVANAALGIGYATLSFNATALGLGNFPLTAAYSGDPDDQPSDTSATPASVTILGIPTTAALALSAAQIPVQGSITLTASISSAASTPTGYIVFSSNGATLGAATLNASGTATFTLDSTAIGSFALTAAYTPTGLYAATSSTPQTLAVTPPLTAAFSPASMSAAAGYSGTATLMLTPLSGFTGAIQTACQTSNPFVQCTVNSAGTITGSGPVSVPVQVSVSKTTASLSHPAAPGIAGPLLALLLPLLATRKSRRTTSKALRYLSLILTLAGASLLITGCAPDGGDFYSIPAGAQTVTVTVTAAGTTIPSALTLNITN